MTQANSFSMGSAGRISGRNGQKKQVVSGLAAAAG